MEQTTPARPAAVLVVAADEQLLGELGNALESRGHAVVRAQSGLEALEHVRGGGPDAIVVAGALDMPDVELCSRLAREPRLSPHAAILVTRSLTPTGEERVTALRAGAWEILGQPVNVEELALKLARFMRLKLLAEQAATGNLVDPETGLYNLQGIARRIEELGALAIRARASLACLVLAPEAGQDTRAGEVAAACARAIKSATRHSDVPGRLSPAEFAVVAPATDSKGAIRLAQRLAGLLRESSGPQITLRAGYDAVGNLAYAPVSAVDLLVRARRAWRLADIESRLGWIRPYEEITTP